MAPAYTFALHL